jgi:hypothetical protein
MTESLATRLLRMRDGDTVSLRSGPYYAQVAQYPAAIRIEAVFNGHLPADAQLSAEQVQRLHDLGWRPPDDPSDVNWMVTEDWPLSGRTAKALASLMVGALRDVYGLDIDQVEERAFNAFS